MEKLLSEDQYNFVDENDKKFIIAFDKALTNLGYESNGIVPYVCWGKYMTAYSRAGLKTKKYIARFYYRDNCIIFRLYFTNIDKHSKYIQNAPECIKTAFTNLVGACNHCENNCKDEQGNCSHRKTYTIDEVKYEKCDGQVFCFDDHNVETVSDYINLIEEFYPIKKKPTQVKSS